MWLTISLDAYLKGTAALVTALFASMVLVAAPRKPANQYLAMFLLLIAGNQSAEMLRAVAMDPHWKEIWFRVATACAALDPFFLYYFASLFPARNHLNRWPAVLAILLLSSVLALVGATANPTSYGLGPLAFELPLAIFTAVVYFVAAANFLRLPLEGSARLLAVAFCVAFLPVCTRIAASLSVVAQLDAATLEGAILRAALWLGMVVAGTAALLQVARPLGPHHRARSIRISIAVAIAFTVGSNLPDAEGLLVAAGILREPTTFMLAFGRGAAALRWLIFALLVSAAALRQGILGLDGAQRSLWPRVLVAGGFVATAALVIGVSRGGSGLLAFEAIDVAFLVGALFVSQGFRTLIDRAAHWLYAVPVQVRAGDPYAAYQSAVALALAQGRDPAEDLDLKRRRAELGIDEASASVLERIVEASSPAPLVAGRLVAGRYRLSRMVGRGGAGRVFLAHDELLGRDVVIKEILHDGTSDRAIEEARIAGSAQHPNVVTMLDAVAKPGATLLVMEHVSGGSLAERLRRGHVAPHEARRILDGILAGLEAVHARGIVHADLKPENVFLRADGSPVIGDFGIATRNAGGTIAHPGELVLGTPEFMAPEQRRGEAAGVASDLYAVGLLARLCLGNAVEGSEFLASALAQDPRRRFASAREMRAALQRSR